MKEDELAVLLIDKKDNADGEKVINFYTQEQALGQQQYLPLGGGNMGHVGLVIDDET